MARNWFGGDLTAWVFRRDDSIVPNLVQLVPGAPVEFYSAPTGGTRYTDLRLGGLPVTVIPASTGSDGYERGTLPAFQGPDNSAITSMYAQVTGATVRYLVVATNTGDTVTQLRADLSTVTNTAGAFSVWSGAAYVPPTGGAPRVYFGPADPGSVPEGSVWIPNVLDQLGAGVRASFGAVGYRGNPADLTVLNPGDSFAGTPFAGVASWLGNSIIASGPSITVEGYRINGALFFSGGVSPIVRNCIINVPAGEGNGLAAAANGSTLTVEDTTIVGGNVTTALSCLQKLIARRLNIFGGQKGIVVTAQPGSTLADGSFVTQCWLHDQSYPALEQDVDGIEVRQHPTLATYVTIEHCLIDGVRGPGGVAMSSGVTLGEASGSTAGMLTAKVDNNGILSGARHLQIDYRTQGCTVTNNNLGTLVSAAGETALAAVAVAGSVTTWTGNVNGAGGTVANPNP